MLTWYRSLASCLALFLSTSLLSPLLACTRDTSSFLKWPEVSDTMSFSRSLLNSAIQVIDCTDVSNYLVGYQKKCTYSISLFTFSFTVWPWVVLCNKCPQYTCFSWKEFLETVTFIFLQMLGNYNIKIQRYCLTLCFVKWSPTMFVLNRLWI